eukprot:2671442-Prymnesium_polylepis.1
MSAEALKLISMKEAAKRVKSSAATRKSSSKTAKAEEGGDTDVSPFEMGPICWLGVGQVRRHVTILEIANAKPLKYK